MAPLREARRFFITAKADTPLLRLLQENLDERCDPRIIIDSGGAWKDRKRILNPNQLIRAKETVKINTSEFQGKTYVLNEADIIFENRDLLVVYKPANLNVHNVPASIYYNLTHGVNQYLRRRGVPFETTPVTRLDRPVSGLVIFPRCKEAERRLFHLVKERKIKKWYAAALERRSSPGPDRIRIQDRISSRANRTCLDPNGKFADSLFIKTQTLDQTEIYSVFIFTGRRHQIRFHASHYIAPIIGDRPYGSSVKKAPHEIALTCIGYNIPYDNKNLRIRLYAHGEGGALKHASISEHHFQSGI
jgi:23S rRNA-/tRNA-specific pseudouridylate synthase